MSRVCELTGKKPETGNKVSHSNRKSRIRWLPNLKTKRYRIPELSDVIQLTLSTRAIRTIDKQGGLVKAIFDAKEETLSPQLLKIKNTIRARSRVAVKQAAPATTEAKATKTVKAPKATAKKTTKK